MTGSKNEDQVLNAIEAYTEFRPELAHKAINQLFDIARIQHCSQLLRALQVRTGSEPGRNQNSPSAGLQVFPLPVCSW